MSNNIKDVLFSSTRNVLSVSPSKIYVTDGQGKVKWSRSFQNAKYVSFSNRDDVVVGLDGVYFFKGDGTLMWVYNTTYNISSAVVSESGRYVVFSTEDRYLGVLNNTGSLQWKYFLGNRITALDISNDEEYLALGTYNGQVYLFKTSQG